MSDDKRWLAMVTVRAGEDGAAAEQVLTRIGYRGSTWHATKEEAEAAAREMLAAAATEETSLRWFAIWAKPYVGHLPNDEESGRCFSATRVPAEGR